MKREILIELWLFIKHRKKWWLAPIIILLFVLSLILFLEIYELSPFIYALF